MISSIHAYVAISHPVVGRVISMCIASMRYVVNESGNQMNLEDTAASWQR